MDLVAHRDHCTGSIPEADGRTCLEVAAKISAGRRNDKRILVKGPLQESKRWYKKIREL